MSKNKKLAIVTLIAVPALAGLASVALLARKKCSSKNEEEVALEENTK